MSDLSFLSDPDYRKIVRQLGSIKRILARFIGTIEEKRKTFEPVETLEV